MRIVGEHVRLRPLAREDMPRRLEMVNDPEVQEQIIGVAADKNTEFDMFSWFQMMSEDEFSEQWAIEDEDGTYIGDIDLHSIHVIRDEAWISPMVGDKRYWADPAHRKEAVSLVTRYAFDEKGVKKVQIDLPSGDAHGVALLEELGFSLVEEFMLDMFSGAKTLSYAVTPESFTGPASIVVQQSG